MPVKLQPSLWIAPFVGALLAVGMGALVGSAPVQAVAAMAVLLVLILAFITPVAHLVLLLLVVVLVPYNVQNSFGEGPGVIATDVLLFAGLARAGLVLLRQPMPRRQALMAAMTGLVLLIAVLQFARGLGVGSDPAETGTELRSLIGVSVFFIALPLTFDPRSRGRLFVGILLVGLAMGIWGLAHSKTGSGLGGGAEFRSQVEAAAYGFPVATLLSFAKLISSDVRSRLETSLLVAVFLCNGVALALTYERAFWIATGVGLLAVAVRAGRRPLMRAVMWTPPAILLVLALFASVAPQQFTGASQRLLSVGDYKSDASVRYRIIESRHVVQEVRRRPILGSGLGATIYWGRVGEGVPPKSYAYTHNGYLWLIWKLGVFGAMGMALLFAAALLQRGNASGPSAAVRNGSQASLMVLLIVGVTAPVFSTGATPLTGLLLALSVLSIRPSPTVSPDSARQSGAPDTWGITAPSSPTPLPGRPLG